MLEHLILSRHGETEWNVAGRAQGRADSPLTPMGIEQARALGRVLAARGVEHIVTSTLPRALHTGEIAAGIVGCTVSMDERLVERSFGVLEGRSLADVFEEDPSMVPVLRGYDPALAAPGGESLHEVAERMLAALATIRELPYRSVAVVTHGQCMTATLGALLKGGEYASYRHGNCGYTPLGVNSDGFIVDRWNIDPLELVEA
ncbi:MAG: histidine phosphatase family protein [Luteibacter sp.]